MDEETKTIISNNKMFSRGKNKCFTITEAKPFVDVYKRAINFRMDIDGLLVEHKNWYETSNRFGFDPRLYIIVKGYDNILYAVSFKDYIREDVIKQYEGKRDDSFVEIKIIKAEDMFDNYVLAKVSNVSNSLSPVDPLNIYKVEHLGIDDENDSESSTYSIDSSSLLGLKLLIGINNLRNSGVNQIVISTDKQMVEYLNSFYLKFLFQYSTHSKFVPRNVSSYIPGIGDLVMCNPVVAKEYEENGYKLIEIKSRDLTESILSRRIEGRREKW